jgi:peptidoglycan hydrolase-like protein with peptidoglycan-binding domain
LRSAVIHDLAFQTYLGVHDFFDPKDLYTTTGAYDTAMLPYAWKVFLDNVELSGINIFALQTALMFDGAYPPPGKSKNECPRTGGFGSCTRTALEFFQNKHGISGEKWVVGEKTIEALNRL